MKHGMPFCIITQEYAYFFFFSSFIDILYKIHLIHRKLKDTVWKLSNNGASSVKWFYFEFIEGNTRQISEAFARM